MATTSSRADFEKVFPSLMEDVLNDARKFKVPQNALEWFQKVKASSHFRSPILTAIHNSP